MSLKSKLKLKRPMRPAGREPQSINAIILNKSRTPRPAQGFNSWLPKESRQIGGDKGPRGSEAAEAESTVILPRAFSVFSHFFPLPFLACLAPPTAILGPYTYPCPSQWIYPSKASQLIKTETESCLLYKIPLESSLCPTSGSQIMAAHTGVMWGTFTCLAFSSQDFYSICLDWSTSYGSFSFFQRFLEDSNTWLDLDATLEWHIFSFHSAFPCNTLLYLGIFCLLSFKITS